MISGLFVTNGIIYIKRFFVKQKSFDEPNWPTKTKGRIMAKGKNAQKTNKKKPGKTLKEKRSEKKEKKAQKGKI